MKKRLSTILGALVIGASTLGLGACQQPADESISPSFGDSVRHNMAVQIINPSPGLTPALPSDLDGRRAAGVIERYGAGKEAAPIEIRTTDE